MFCVFLVFFGVKELNWEENISSILLGDCCNLYSGF